MLAFALLGIGALLHVLTQCLVLDVAENFQTLAAFRAVCDEEMRPFRGRLVDLGRNYEFELARTLERLPK